MHQEYAQQCQNLNPHFSSQVRRAVIGNKMGTKPPTDCHSPVCAATGLLLQVPTTELCRFQKLASMTKGPGTASHTFIQFCSHLAHLEQINYIATMLSEILIRCEICVKVCSSQSVAHGKKFNSDRQITHKYSLIDLLFNVSGDATF